MSRPRSERERERDHRDLRALALLDEGLTQAEVCRRLGMHAEQLRRLRQALLEDEGQAR